MKRTTKSLKTRIMASCLAAAMLWGCLPMTAYAEEYETPVEEPVVVMSEEAPAEEAPAIEEPTIEEPQNIEEPVIEEPVIEEPVIEEPVIEEPVIEEPVIEEPIIEEPVIEEPVIEEPVIEDPVIEEPVIEEAPAAEPVPMMLSAAPATTFAAPASDPYQSFIVVYNGLEDATPSLTAYAQNYNDLPKDGTLTVPDPTRPGYTFDGWTLTGMDHGASKLLASNAKGITLNCYDLYYNEGVCGFLTLTANWTAVPVAEPVYTYNIVYKGVEGAANTNPATINSDEILPIADPTKDGFTFTGWTSDFASGKNVQLNGLAIKAVLQTGFIIDTVYLTAHWEAALPAITSYRIEYTLNGGVNNAANPATVGSTESVTILQPTREGYAFKGWDCSLSEFNGTDVVLSGAAIRTKLGDLLDFVTLSAKWESTTPTAQNYIVSYHGMEGDITPALSTYGLEVPKNGTLTVPDPAKPGFVFTGWTVVVEDRTTELSKQIMNGVKNLTLSANELDNTYNGNGFVDLTANWAPAPTAVAAPTAGSFTYTGTEQTALTAPAGTTLSGTVSATNAGNYTVTVTPNAGYVWADGSDAPLTLNWAIAPAALTAAYAGESVTTAGTPALTVAVTGFVNGETAATAAGYAAPAVTAPAVTAPAPLAAGTYPLMPAGGNADNYTFTYVAGDLIVTAAPTTPTTPPTPTTPTTPTTPDTTTPDTTPTVETPAAVTPVTEVPVVTVPTLPVPLTELPAATFVVPSAPVALAAPAAPATPAAVVATPDATTPDAPAAPAEPEADRTVTVTPVEADAITEEDTPLAAPEAEIDENDTPLANLTAKGNNWSLIALLLTFASIFAGLWMLVGKHKAFEDDEDTAEQNETSKHRSALNRTAAVVLAVLGILAFVLLQNLAAPMVLFNRYTIVSLVVFALQAVNGVLGHKKNEKPEEQQ